MHDLRPIGIFDSGAGGLSVLQGLIKELPYESFVYYADSANCPYGSKPPERIIELSARIVDFLISKNCKIIVVACNTATAAAIDWLRDNYDIPFVGMEPAVKPAAINSISKSIGVLATAGTFKGRLYNETSRKYTTDINVCYQIGEGLVELVEQGKQNSPEAVLLLSKYLQPMIESNIDQLVLGCSHYPFFIPLLSKLLPPTVEIIDPSPAVAKQTVRLLLENKLNGNKTNENQSFTFFSSSNTLVLKKIMDGIAKEQGYSLQNITYSDNLVL
jgi:glutamate racemase